MDSKNLQLFYRNVKRTYRTHIFREASTEIKNYYEILNIQPDSTQTEIREAYYKKIKKIHPDINPSPLAKLQFYEVREAFKVLKNCTGRELYNDKYNIEKTLMETAQEIESHWMNKKRYGGTKLWYEKVAMDNIFSSALRHETNLKLQGKTNKNILKLHEVINGRSYIKPMDVSNKKLSSNEDICRKSIIITSLNIFIIVGCYFLTENLNLS